MLLLCRNTRRRQSLFLLLLLLITAAPIRPTPIGAEADNTLASWRRSNSYTNSNTNTNTNINSKSNWPNSYQTLDDSPDGRPLPNILAREMASEEFVDIADSPRALNFLPPFPMNLKSRWRRGRHWKELLQVHRTWQQSPDQAHTKLKRAMNYSPNEYDESPEQLDDPFNYYFFYPGHKREPSDQRQRPVFRPSISSGVMTNLGDFFNQLKANVHYAEHSHHHLGEEESQILEGLHPHQQTDLRLTGDTDVNDGDYNSGQPPDRKLSKLHSYRPSQKIRSLVSRNPNGYRGSQFIDPSYMWLGLGK